MQFGVFVAVVRGLLDGVFARDCRGAVGVIFGLTLVPMVAAVGSALDYTRRTDATTAMQRAVDAAALAAATAAKEKRDPAVTAVATFHATFQRSETEAAVPLYSFRDGRHRVTAQGRLPTRFMSAVGYSGMRIEVTAEAIYRAAQAEPVEIALVVDSTNSMFCNCQWPEVVKAISAMLQTLKADGSQPYFVTLVPMADRVNVSSISGSATSWMAGQMPQNWNGCLEPRERAVPGFPHALDDARPTSNNDKFLPSAPGSFIPNHVGASYGPGGVPACPSQPITGPTGDVREIETALGNLSGWGTGRFDEGMAWGWRVLSEKWQGQWKVGNSYPSKNGARRKIAIFVSDGQTSAYDHEVGGSAGGSFGWNRGSRRGFEHFVQVCTGMRAQGIEIHVLQAEGNPDFDAYARQCATSAQTHHRVKDAESVKLALRNITPAGGEILRLVR
jgi:Flp pilus assembly protein TadG